MSERSHSPEFTLALDCLVDILEFFTPVSKTAMCILRFKCVQLGGAGAKAVENEVGRSVIVHSGSLTVWHSC
jgi:hypothetical protein